VDAGGNSIVGAERVPKCRVNNKYLLSAISAVYYGRDRRIRPHPIVDLVELSRRLAVGGKRSAATATDPGEPCTLKTQIDLPASTGCTRLVQY